MLVAVARLPATLSNSKAALVTRRALRPRSTVAEALLWPDPAGRHQAAGARCATSLTARGPGALPPALLIWTRLIVSAGWCKSRRFSSAGDKSFSHLPEVTSLQPATW